MARLFAIVLGLVSVAFPGVAPAATRAVVELFTSQGCASCRPADAYLVELAKRDDILVLSYHVDYWDFLGWRDTLAGPESGQRQRAYAKAFGSRRIYTPQMVVNGVSDLVGSDRDDVEAALSTSSLSVPVSLHRTGERLEIEVGARPTPGGRTTTIRLIAFQSAATVRIDRGENAGATIEYANVARASRPIGMWSGAVVKITLPQYEVMDGADGCAVIVQEENGAEPGAILGAAAIDTRSP